MDCLTSGALSPPWGLSETLHYFVNIRLPPLQRPKGTKFPSVHFASSLTKQGNFMFESPSFKSILHADRNSKF